MSNVIHVKFGEARLADEMREQVTRDLLEAGRLAGDDESLIRAKAERLLALIDKVLDESVPITPKVQIPADLTPRQLEMVNSAMKDTCEQALRAVKRQYIEALMGARVELLTSKLAAAGDLT